ncbi:plasmid stabilization protein [Mesorhizobium sp. CAU 1732]|uniref:FitA-like ribbon-helix-helix domain-containing protein n=1 Tax=Mesorhizobium sp. CAU 1732 TaxID=3140358 RepID=UPI0032606BD1
MGDMLIRNIPDALKDEIAQAAAKGGASLSSEAIGILRDGLQARQKSAVRKGKSAWDVLRPLFYDENDPEAGEEFAKIMDEVEAERKRDFGRPVPDFE